MSERGLLVGPAAAGVGAAGLGAGSVGLGDLDGGVAQGWADVVDVELDDGALVAVAGLERALPQPALHDDAVSAREAFGDVLGGIAPDGAAHEQCVAVAPFSRLAVECPRCRGHGEVGDRVPVLTATLCEEDRVSVG